MRRELRRTLGVSVALSGLVVAHRLIDPAPLPALGVVIGGLLAFALGRTGWFVVGSGALGCAGASALHAFSHIAEGRVESVWQTVMHVGLDALAGAALGALLLLMAFAVDRWVLRGGTRGGAT